ncbi:hypothetical protein GQ457_01G014870 [Hibiscus cannabinus]
MEFDGEIVKFNVYKAMWNAENVQGINFVGIFKHAIDEFIETDFVNDLCWEVEDFEEEIKKFEKSFSAPNIELKPPPKHLTKGYTLSANISKIKKIRKYAYVNNQTYTKETKRLHVRRISLKEILSWIKRKKWRKL